MDDLKKLSGAAHQPAKKFMRRAGVICIALGLLCIILGIGSFFFSFIANMIGISSGETTFSIPYLFPLAFIGGPIFFIGIVMAVFGYMGAVARYQAAEIAPVASDTVNYMGKSTKPGVRSFASAISEGLTEGAMAGSGSDFQDMINCPVCEARNQTGSKFCDQCGVSIAEIICSNCSSPNQPGSKFCDQCGNNLSDH
ncbi:double zinc ribbon domain-containing protein [Poriferisphaera sp. WC338]|uniref:zinc ribbon domain-containing protein n=1 Tax=Poriferisphaera sp. WC338 TaxID=3425129 RepID=UPI003D814A0A